MNVFNENENASSLTARGSKTGLGGQPKRALQDVTNASVMATFGGKKQVRPVSTILEVQLQF